MHAKITVALPDDPSFGPYRQESIHASALGEGRYQLLNVPALANGIHLHDVVRCTVTEGELPRFEEVLEPSGWGTLHVIAQDTLTPDAREALLTSLHALGGLIEQGLGVIAVGLPPGTDPEVVLALLDPSADRGELVYEMQI